MKGSGRGGARTEIREEGVPEWVVTFADLMTLLFCFFVLLTTLSAQPKNCGGLQNYLEKNKQLFKSFELRSSKLECILSLPSDYLFKSGSDSLQPQALRFLDPLFQSIKAMDDHKNDLVVIEGHTDNVPIKTRQFPSNMILSTARANNMFAYLTEKIRFPKDRVSVTAYADTRPKVSYQDEGGRPKAGKELNDARKINRRVEIILIKKPESRKATSLLFGDESQG